MKAPFGKVGGKYVGHKFLIDLMPRRSRYIEVFGGSGIILLNKSRVKFEVFNDLEQGLVDFYKCIQDSEKIDRLIEKLELTQHSREFWETCRFAKSDDIVDRAFNWYYTIRMSFGQQGRGFGRATGNTNPDSIKLYNSLPGFREIHERLRGVLIECRSYRAIIPEFDRADTLFYLDPPYIGTFKN